MLLPLGDVWFPPAAPTLVGASPSPWRLTPEADTVMRRDWLLLAVIRFTREPDPPNSPWSIHDMISLQHPLVKKPQAGLTASSSPRSKVVAVIPALSRSGVIRA